MTWNPSHPTTAAVRGLLLLVLGLALCAGPARAQNDPGPVPAVDTTSAGSPASPEPLDSVESSAPATEPASETVRATPNARPAIHKRRVKLEHSSRNVVRSGPGESFAIVGVYPEHAEFTVIAKSGDWYNVRLSDTETGWIHSSLCKEMDDFSDLEFKPNPKLYSRTGSFVLTGYGGAYAYDRKSNSLVLGGRLGYYVFDFLQADGGVSWTHVRRPAEIVESLFDLSLEAEDFDMLSYHLGATWELLPGRQMVPYVSGGIGSTLMQGETETAFNVAGGTTLFLSKRNAMRWEFREYWFHSGPSEARVLNNNIEFTLGTSVLF
jgi:outer membrane beta-barrel protein